MWGNNRKMNLSKAMLQHLGGESRITRDSSVVLLGCEHENYQCCYGLFSSKNGIQQKKYKLFWCISKAQSNNKGDYRSSVSKDPGLKDSKYVYIKLIQTSLAGKDFANKIHFNMQYMLTNVKNNININSL